MKMLSLYPLILSLVIGGGTSILAYIFYLLVEKIKRLCLASITIQNTDPCYNWLLRYLIEKDYLNQNMSDSIVRRVLQKLKFGERRKEEKPKVEYHPAPGNHYFQFRGKRMWAYQKKGKTNVVGWESRPETEESIVIFCYGNDITIIQQLIDEAIEFQMEEQKGMLQIYEVVSRGRWDAWLMRQSKKARSLDSVLLDSGITQDLVEDIKDFQNSSEWYMSKGVPYRRGYMLYGPPGTGKTSFTQAVAGALGFNLCYLNLSANEINDDSLNRMLSDAPPSSIILLEDIDALFTKRLQSSKGDLTFSGFLNALDGVRSQEGQILFMTTNHLDRIDEALLRPGRTDVKVHLNMASENQISGIFDRFFPRDYMNNPEGKYTLEFTNALPVEKLSMAKLQGHLLKYRDNPKECAENAKELLQDEEQTTGEMRIEEWLHRLNLLHLLQQFIDQKIRRVTDLKYIEKIENFDEFGITTKGDKRRIWMMIKGDHDTKNSFQYLSRHGVRELVTNFFSSKRDVQELVENVPENTLTGFQLKDIFDSCGQKAEIKKKIYEVVLFNKRFPRAFRVQKSSEEEDGQKDDLMKEKKIQFDLDKFLKDCGIGECMRKLKKEDLDDPELFFKIDLNKLMQVMDIKLEGKKHKVEKKITELRERLGKEGSICYLDPGLLEEGQELSLKKTNSHMLENKDQEQLEILKNL